MTEDFDYIILEKYLMQAAHKMKGAYIQKGRMNFRCNVCGDSLTKKNVKRGFLLLNTKSTEKHWVYYCQRPECEANKNPMSGANWLKFTDSFLYNAYRNEIKLCNRDDSHADKMMEKIEKQRIIREKEIKEQLEKKRHQEAEDVKHFRPIEVGTTQVFEDAKSYCVSRKIPYDIWKNFFVAIDGKYKDRIIIPFFDKQDEIYYWQGRHLYGAEPKYLNRSFAKNDAVYNLHNIDKTKPVIILEGSVDSMMIENSIATLGLALSDDMQKNLNDLDCHYLCDNDKPGNQQARRYLKSGKYVFMWKDFLKFHKLPSTVKDINECMIKLNRSIRFSYEDLKPFFTNSYIDCLYFS